MKKILVVVGLALSFIATPVFAKSISEEKLSAISEQVNHEAAGIDGNCLIVAIEKQRRLLELGVKSEVVAFMPWDAERRYNRKTGKYEKIGHAVLCAGDKCVDNGDLTSYVFDRDEIRYHGEILVDYKGKRLAAR